MPFELVKKLTAAEVIVDADSSHMKIFVVVAISAVLLSLIGIIAARRSWVFGRLTCLVLLVILSVGSLFFGIPSLRVHSEQVNARERPKAFMEGMVERDSRILPMQLV